MFSFMATSFPMLYTPESEHLSLTWMHTHYTHTVWSFISPLQHREVANNRGWHFQESHIRPPQWLLQCHQTVTKQALCHGYIWSPEGQQPHTNTFYRNTWMKSTAKSTTHQSNPSTDTETTEVRTRKRLKRETNAYIFFLLHFKNMHSGTNNEKMKRRRKKTHTKEQTDGCSACLVLDGCMYSLSLIHPTLKSPQHLSQCNWSAPPARSTQAVTEQAG